MKFALGDICYAFSLVWKWYALIISDGLFRRGVCSFIVATALSTSRKCWLSPCKWTYFLRVSNVLAHLESVQYKLCVIESCHSDLRVKYSFLTKSQLVLTTIDHRDAEDHVEGKLIPLRQHVCSWVIVTVIYTYNATKTKTLLTIIFWQWNGYIIITFTALLLIWRSGAGTFYPSVPDFQMSCSDFNIVMRYVRM